MTTSGEGTRVPRVRIGWFVAGTLGCALAGATWQARRPAFYRAECILDYGREPLVASGPSASSPLSEEWYRTQDIVLASHTLAERVVQELRLDRDRSYVAADAIGAPEAVRSDAASKLRAGLSITPTPNTRVVRVAIEDTNAKRAARIANALVDAYLKKAVEDRVAATERALAWISDQIGATSRRLSATESELQTSLERQEGAAVPPEERQAMLTEEIKRLTQATTDTRLQRIELSARLAKLKGAAQADNPFDARAQELDTSDEVKQLRSAYLALMIERARRLPDETQDEPQQRMAQKQLDALWSHMQRMLDSFVRSTQAELTAVQQMEIQLQSALERANAAGRALQREQLEYGRLNRERSEIEEWLKALHERSSTAGISTAAGVVNARVIDPAVPPRAPLPPPLLLGAGLGTMAGLLLSGLAAAVVSRARSLRPRESQDATQAASEHIPS